MIEIPDIAKSGVLIDPVDPQPEVRKNAEMARDWDGKWCASLPLLPPAAATDGRWTSDF